MATFWNGIQLLKGMSFRNRLIKGIPVSAPQTLINLIMRKLEIRRTAINKKPFCHGFFYFFWDGGIVHSLIYSAAPALFEHEQEQPGRVAPVYREHLP